MMKQMLFVVMDGIKDAEMIAGYAEDAAKHGADRSVINWFVVRAQNRFSMAERDWHDVLDEIKDEKHDDDLVEALECHVKERLAALRERVEKL